ncbi:hypothetical protein MHU86_1851 [Fragilaria crotonensis]|nr:hypothetical protein MHU86_1851 [Fragilaria crotonensis]
MPSLSRRRGNHNLGGVSWRWGSNARLSLCGICLLAYLALRVSDDYDFGATSLDVAIHAPSESQRSLIPEIVVTTAAAQEVPASSEIAENQDRANVELNSSPQEQEVQAASESQGVQAPPTKELRQSDIIGMPQMPAPGTGFKTGDKKILVVYSGPTVLADLEAVRQPGSPSSERLKELYRLNFEYFLKYGVQCRTQDTLVMVTEVVQQRYQPQIDALHSKCQQHGHRVIMAIRNSTCWDLESVRRAMHDDIVDLNLYDYFVYVNCGTSGPSRLWADLPWTDVLLEKLNDKVKMSGLTLNCGSADPHLQSMVYALDREGLQIIRESDAVFECEEALKTFTGPPGFTHANEVDKRDHLIISRYESGMGRILLQKIRTLTDCPTNSGVSVECIVLSG